MADNIGNFSSSGAATTAITAVATGPGPGSNGLHALTSSPSDSAVYGEHQGNGIGVFGRGGADGGEGVFGETMSGSSGVFGKNGANGNGVTGESLTGNGVSGLCYDGGIGVRGEGRNAGIGVFGKGELGAGFDGIGVLGSSDEGSGVTGDTNHGVGVVGYAGQSDGVGVEGSTSIVGGYGLWGGGGDIGLFVENYADGPIGAKAFVATRHLAADFYGDVFVHGSITKSGGGFKIDHPLDPANRYLSHSFVESSEAKNIYDGVVALNPRGEATVNLPDWFEAVNKDFRYQLTAIGGPAPNLHVVRELASGAFGISGGAPGQRVSWQVTGVRKDAWAKAHPTLVEEEKPPAERDHFLHPTLYGKPESEGLLTARYPKHSRKVEARLTRLKKHMRRNAKQRGD